MIAACVFITVKSLETHAFGFRLRANAPEGQKRFPISAFPLRAMPVFRHSLRWLTPLLAVLMLLAARPAAAITRHDGARPQFEESLVSKLPKDQQAMWKWVASGERGTIPFSGVLIRNCHILTCAHAFFENASEGTGKLTADPKTISFSFPDPADPLNEKVYDFDKKDENTSDLKNGLTGKPSSFTKWEGSPAGGDSGSPMFIMLDKEPVVVGVTSSGSSSLSKYGENYSIMWGNIALSWRG
jgi:hypothetical protein